MQSLSAKHLDRIEGAIRVNLGTAGFDELVALLTTLLAGFGEGDAYPQH